VRGRLQFLQRLDPQLVVEALGQDRADASDRGQQGDRVTLAPQPVQHRQPARGHELVDRARQALPDARQFFETFDSFGLDERRHRPRQMSQHQRGPPVGFDPVRVGFLLGQQARHFLQAACDLAISA
jgi:hypothetical protein